MASLVGVQLWPEAKFLKSGRYPTEYVASVFQACRTGLSVLPTALRRCSVSLNFGLRRPSLFCMSAMQHLSENDMLRALMLR